MKSDKLILSQIKLAPAQKRIVLADTPPEFIKKRQGRGGKEFTYVEGGYVVAKLNEAFSPVGWEFEVLEEKVVENSGKVSEVWVRGRLTVVDHKNGYRVSKTQYGTHQHHDGNFIGDTLKSASTDCLKKCASYFGIALDVYWTQLDDDQERQIKGQGKSEKKQPPKTPEQKFQDAVKMIAAQSNIQVLKEWRNKIADSKLYNDNQRQALLFSLTKVALQIDQHDE